MALAERTITEALRVFAPRTVAPRAVAARGVRQGLRHAPAPAVTPVAQDEFIAMVDERTITGEPSANAVLVYGPAPLLVDTLRVDVTPEEWQAFASIEQTPANGPSWHIGALRGGVLVAMATAARPQGKLSRLRVVVSPAFRQLGLGHLVLHRAVQHVLREGLLPYATFVSTDLGARALAKAVGFVNITRAFDAPLPAY